jgi:hypothetical protein
MIMREVLILIAIGVFVAAPLTWWLAKITSSELFEIKPNDPFVISQRFSPSPWFPRSPVSFRQDRGSNRSDQSAQI